VSIDSVPRASRRSIDARESRFVTIATSSRAGSDRSDCRSPVSTNPLTDRGRASWSCSVTHRRTRCASLSRAHTTAASANLRATLVAAAQVRPTSTQAAPFVARHHRGTRWACRRSLLGDRYESRLPARPAIGAKRLWLPSARPRAEPRTHSDAPPALATGWLVSVSQSSPAPDVLDRR
jgi:hypothetical protein